MGELTGFKERLKEEIDRICKAVKLSRRNLSIAALDGRKDTILDWIGPKNTSVRVEDLLTLNSFLEKEHNERFDFNAVILGNSHPDTMKIKRLEEATQTDLSSY